MIHVALDAFVVVPLWRRLAMGARLDFRKAAAPIVIATVLVPDAVLVVSFFAMLR